MLFCGVIFYVITQYDEHVNEFRCMMEQKIIALHIVLAIIQNPIFSSQISILTLDVLF